MLPVSDVIPSRTTPVVTVGLIATCTLVFLVPLLLDPPGRSMLAESFGLVPARPRWIAAATSLFVHAGWLQVIVNMLCLWIFGENVEDRLGHGLFLAFYLAAGAAANLAVAVMQPGHGTPLLGAAPAVAAVMGAYFVMFPGSQVLIVVHVIVYADVVEAPAGFMLALWATSEVFTHLAPIGAPLGDTLVPLVPHLLGLGTGAVAGAMLRRRRMTWA
jgi:membrane associated rhomboid family serine protease